MHRIVSAFLLLLSVWDRAPQTFPLTLRVLTYNIHHGEGTDGLSSICRVSQAW